MVGLVMIFFSPPSQKLAFMVSLGLVTHDHLEGRKNVLSWFLNSLFHGLSELKVRVQNICVLSAVFSCTKVHLGCLHSWSNLVCCAYFFYSFYYIETNQLLMQQRSAVGKNVYALMVGKQFVTIPLLSGQPLYLQSYTMVNFTVTHMWAFLLFHDVTEL